MVIWLFYLKTFFNFQHIEIEIVIENGLFYHRVSASFNIKPESV